MLNYHVADNDVEQIDGLSTRLHKLESRIKSRSLALILLLGCWCMLSFESSAQPLSPALCPVAGPNPFNPQPTFSQFVFGQPGIPLLRRTIDTSIYPDAVCNDGSPAVMYIRPANAAFGGNPISSVSRKWLIMLDGGGGCRNSDDCLLTRWCSGGDAVFDRAGKMTSRAAYQAISANGIFELAPPAPVVNYFTDFNHVLVNYCSSDNWIGSSNLSGINTSTGTSFDIHFQGEAIVNAVITTLASGPIAADTQPTLTFYNTTMPNLQAASEVVLVGESAGGGGMRHHVDRLREDMLEPAIADPNVVIAGIIDAGIAPAMSDSGIDWSDPFSPGDYRDHLSNIVEPSIRNFWGANDSALDQSCLDSIWTLDHEASGGHPQVCYDTTYTLLNHITTPLFVRMDIDDPLAKPPYSQWNLFPFNDEYWTALFDQLSVFSTYSTTSGGLENPLRTPGIQGPNCRLHVAIQTNDGFYHHRITGPGVPPLSFHDLFVNWHTGAAAGLTTQQIQTDNLGVGMYSQSFCP